MLHLGRSIETYSVWQCGQIRIQEEQAWYSWITEMRCP